MCGKAKEKYHIGPKTFFFFTFSPVIKCKIFQLQATFSMNTSFVFISPLLSRKGPNSAKITNNMEIDAPLNTYLETEVYSLEK